MLLLLMKQDIFLVQQMNMQVLDALVLQDMVIYIMKIKIVLILA